MIKKRIIGVVTVKENLVVQSIGYKRYLPIGSVTNVVENLDRWGADEICILCIDRSIENKGPNYKILKEIDNLFLTTPLSYGGGIRNAEDAIKVIKNGFERVIIDSLIFKGEEKLKLIADIIGKQALIYSMPCTEKDNKIFRFNYLSQKLEHVDIYKLINLYKNGYFSEIFLVDYLNEGIKNSFKRELINFFKKDVEIPLILFGGITDEVFIDQLFGIDIVKAIAIGNSLNFKEHSIQKIKNKLKTNKVRRPYFDKI